MTAPRNRCCFYVIAARYRVLRAAIRDLRSLIMPPKTNINHLSNVKNNTNKNTNTIQPARLTETQNSEMNSPENENWTTQTGKRNLSSSSSGSTTSKSPSQKTTQPKIKKLFFSTRNRYEPLTITEPADTVFDAVMVSEDPDIAVRAKPPPPIFMKGINDFPGFCTSLIELIGVDNFICKATTDSLKIQTANPESYRLLIHYLKEHNAKYHTYQLAEDKPTRIVIRNLHPTTPIELIKSELETRLFEVRKVTNVLHKTSKHPLPLFFVDLEPTEHSNQIYQLSFLLHTKIKVEEPYKPKLISQCQNCQDYGHTRAYCGYSARCVRCSANHSSSECTKSPDSPSKCVLCSGDHPANYRGCSVYKELQRRKTPTTKSNLFHDTIKPNVKPYNVKESHPLAILSEKNESNPPKTYAQTTASQPPQPSPPSDLTQLMSSFIGELKSLINPLIVLLTQTVLFDKRIDIALIAETHFTKYSHISIPGYYLLKTNHPDGTAHGGAAILIKTSLKFHPLINFSQNHIQSCAISIILNNIPVVIAAHQSWGCRVTNPRGNLLHNFTNIKKLKILAPPDPTYWPTSCKKKPDILDIFISKIPSNLYCTVHNILDLNSDHSSVILNVDATPQTNSVSHSLFSPSTNRYIFHNIIAQKINLSIKLKTEHDIDEAINNLSKLINSAASLSNTVTPYKHSMQKLTPLPEQIRSLIVEKRRARAVYQRTRLPSHKSVYNKLANSLKKTLAKSKANILEQKLTNLSSSD
ncbi:hypothetical protein O181_084342, partial [Austropuccinia psidii MF-1]|nr:hypothetical protein [Austropuccinia psidii MF-1]